MSAILSEEGVSKIGQEFSQMLRPVPRFGHPLPADFKHQVRLVRAQGFYSTLNNAVLVPVHVDLDEVDALDVRD